MKANRLGDDLAERSQLDLAVCGDRQRLNPPIGGGTRSSMAVTTPFHRHCVVAEQASPR
jgi:hypothetical protein